MPSGGADTSSRHDGSPGSAGGPGIFGGFAQTTDGPDAPYADAGRQENGQSTVIPNAPMPPMPPMPSTTGVDTSSRQDTSFGLANGQHRDHSNGTSSEEPVHHDEATEKGNTADADAAKQGSDQMPPTPPCPHAPYAARCPLCPRRVRPRRHPVKIRMPRRFGGRSFGPDQFPQGSFGGGDRLRH